ncbi:MAG: hypothetical protein U0350_13785 [Caldilineaceae bacterium]
MNPSLTRILGLLFLVFWISGCAALDSPPQKAMVLTVDNNISLPAHPLYVLAVSAGTYGNNELVIVDVNSWQVVRRTTLLDVAPWDFSRDPQGRIWVGYGADPGGDHRVQVFAPDGSLLKTFSLCSDPYNLIHFAAKRAFIPCLQNGFHAAVAVVDLQSLEMVKQVDIRITGDNFLLVATGGDEAYFVMAGGGKITNRVVLLDTHTLATLEPIPIPPSNPSRIFAYRGRFLLLNSVPNSPPTGRQDLLIIDITKSPVVSTYPMAASGALWGMLEDNVLYTYHDAEERGFKKDPARAISRLDLNTNKSALWPLPDQWNARDLTLVNGDIILAHSISQDRENDGLYRFDSQTGKLTMLVHILGAQRILPPAP